MNDKSTTQKTLFYVAWGAFIIIGDTLCWGTADYFWAHNLNLAGDFFFWMLWVVSLISIGKTVLESWKRPKIVWSISVGVGLVIGVAIAVVSSRRQPPLPEPPKPDLQLGFGLLGERGLPMFLTNNEFKLFPKRDVYSVEVNEIRGGILTTVPIGISSVRVNFLLVSDSDAEITQIRTKLQLSKDIKYRMDDRWVESPFDDGATTRTYGFETNLNSGLSRNNVLFLPGIEFETPVVRGGPLFLDHG